MGGNLHRSHCHMRFALLGSHNANQYGPAGIRMYIGGKMSPADALLRGFAGTCARRRADLGRFLMPREGIWQGKLLKNTAVSKCDRLPAPMYNYRQLELARRP